MPIIDEFIKIVKAAKNEVDSLSQDDDSNSPQYTMGIPCPKINDVEFDYLSDSDLEQVKEKDDIVILKIDDAEK